MKIRMKKRFQVEITKIHAMKNVENGNKAIPNNFSTLNMNENKLKLEKIFFDFKTVMRRKLPKYSNIAKYHTRDNYSE